MDRKRTPSASGIPPATTVSDAAITVVPVVAFPLATTVVPTFMLVSMPALVSVAIVVVIVALVSSVFAV